MHGSPHHLAVVNPRAQFRNLMLSCGILVSAMVGFFGYAAVRDHFPSRTAFQETISGGEWADILSSGLTLSKPASQTKLFEARTLLLARRDDEAAALLATLPENDPNVALFSAVLTDWRRGSAPETPMHWRHAALNGHPWAMYQLGFLLAENESGDIDYPEAVFWLDKAYGAGVTAAGRALALQFYEQGLGGFKDVSKARAIWQGLAAKGDRLGLLNLGWHYDTGRSGSPDMGLAFRHYTLAAEQGDPIASRNLGNMYEFGRGLATNRKVALMWYERAAALGDVDARDRAARLKAALGKDRRGSPAPPGGAGR